MMCTNRTAFIELALRYEGRFLSRPFVRWEENKKQVFGQVWPDGSAREGIYFFEKFRLNSDYVFRVNGQPYRYLNYTLAPEPPRITYMHPEIQRVDLAPMDFTDQDSLSTYEKDLSVGDLAAMMSAILSTQEVSRELHRLINDNTDDEPLSHASHNSAQLIARQYPHLCNELRRKMNVSDNGFK